MKTTNTSRNPGTTEIINSAFEMGNPYIESSPRQNTEERTIRCDDKTDCQIKLVDDGRVGRFINLGQHLKEHRRMSHSLGLAKEVQQSLLPRTTPQFAGLDIAGKSMYCDETGGDYFDYHELKEKNLKKLGVAIGDVSGHGISAALLMATVRAALRQRVCLGEASKTSSPM